MMPLLVDAAVRSLILGVVIWLGLALFRVRNPAVKSLVWTVALIASLAMPALIESVRALSPPWAEIQLPYDPVATLGALTPGAIADNHNPVTAAAASARATSPFHWQVIVTFGYGLVAMGFMSRLLAGMVLTWRLARAARPFGDNIQGGAVVRISATLTVPVTFGRSILLPADAGEWSGAKREAVLAHEQAHIARGDFYTHLLSKLNRAIFWFSPFAWWLDTQLAALAETASDDAAVRQVGGHLSYAETLIEIAGRAGRVPAGVAMARAAGVGARVERILARIVSRPLTRKAATLAVLGLAPLVGVAAIAIAEPGPATATAQVKIDPAILDRYVGTYEFDPVKAPNQVINITRDGARLFADGNNGLKTELFPQSDRAFTEKGVEIEIDFAADGTGPSSSLFLVMGGHKPGSEAKRVDPKEAVRAKDAIEQKRLASAKPHTAITVDPKIFDNYAGTYRFAGMLFTVTHEGDYLFVQAVGQPKLRVYPESERDFFYREINAQVHFNIGPDAKTATMVFEQDGRDLVMKRADPTEIKEIEAGLTKKIADEARPRTAVAIDPKLLDTYVGRYEASPSNVFTVTRQGDGLFVQFANQPSIAVYPENDHEFFYTVVPAQITFVTDNAGHATQLVLHQNGRDVPAPRVP